MGLKDNLEFEGYQVDIADDVLIFVKMHEKMVFQLLLYY